jgi:hypothetical protein
MRTAWLPAVGLFVLAPVCAEYLWGYDDSTGHPATLIGNLVVFSPLYGAPALLIREAARRHGLGWPGILLLAAAFGVVQAGIVDQSLWSTDYRDIPYWADMSGPTYVAPIGLSVYLLLLFVGGHVVLSIGSPVALVETLAPRRRREPWLGPVAIVVVALLYLAASALVLQDSHATGNADATWGQLAASALAAGGLLVAAFRVGRRPALIHPGPCRGPSSSGPWPSSAWWRPRGCHRAGSASLSSPLCPWPRPCWSGAGRTAATGASSTCWRWRAGRSSPRVGTRSSPRRSAR